MQRDDEFSGSWRMTDEVDGFDLFAGVRWWVTKDECGFSMNDGKGGPAEILSFTHPAVIFAFTKVAALFRRNAYRRRREYATPNFRPLLRNRKSNLQVQCTACDRSGFTARDGALVECEACEGTGWMYPTWMRRTRGAE